MDMDVNTDIVRERSTSSSKNSSKTLSIISQALSIAYYEKMEVMNNLLSKDSQNPINSSQLSYASNNEDIKKVSWSVR